MKNVDEWSVEFDIAWNNIMSNQAPGLSSYEKSVFITDAQEAVVIMLHNGTLRNSFEETEEITNYLSPLVSQATLTESLSSVHHIVDGTTVFRLPDDLLFRTLELCKIDADNCKGKDVVVVPVTQDEFWRTSRNPFKGANENKVLRLAFGSYADTFGKKTDYSELYSKYPITEYTVRYIKRPEPIILEHLDNGLSIRGKVEPCTCKLDEALHQTILMEAVKLAKAVWTS